MAAANLKIVNQLWIEQLQPDFDENWYTDVIAPAEFKKCLIGRLTPFSKMAAAAILKIDHQL